MDPKYRRVADELARRLQAGQYPCGSRLPGHSALGREFGVSSITSNRALAELEARRLVRRVERAGTFALPPVTHLRQVILIMAREPAAAGAMQMDYWRGLTPAAEASGVAVRVCSPQDPGLGDAVQEDPQGTGLISVMTELPASLLRLIRARRVPHVALGMEDEQALYCVTEDRRRACRSLVETMLEDGASRFSFIGKILDRNHRAALDGFQDALVGVRSRPVVARADETSALACAQQVLATEPPPDALVVMGGYMPAAALPAILGHRPPVRLGVLAENSGVLALRAVAYVASYSQVETGRMAFERLADVVAGSIAAATTRYSRFEILRPQT